MKRQIRLLIENLFDDLYDIDQESNLTIDIADKIYNYKIREIYYKNKKPYAICCGLSDDFKDRNPRFCLLNFNKDKRSKWCKEEFFIKELGFHEYYNKIYFKDIDENGYENTQIIKNNYFKNMFPVFNNCIKLGKNVYLPAINELKTLRKNEIFKDLNFKLAYAWSSTQYNETFAFTIKFSNVAQQDKDISGIGKIELEPCIPFIKID